MQPSAASPDAVPEWAGTAVIAGVTRVLWGGSAELLRALDVATRLHAGQERKGTAIPYISHPLGVCSIACEYGATEPEAIAALLHDVLEDVHPNWVAREAVVSFGPVVLAIVVGCTDGEPGDDGNRAPREARHEAYLEHLVTAGPSIVLVSASDKLYNARSIVKDLRVSGEQLWEKFSGPREETLAYYAGLVDGFRANQHQKPRSVRELIDELERTVGEMHRLADLGADREDTGG